MSTYRKIPLIGPDPLTPEWYAKRFTVIGSSDAAKACGVSEYGTPLQLYKEKRGEVESFQGNEHTRRGRRYEPLIAEDWQELTGRTLRRYPCPMFIHPDYPWMAATPDGEIDDDEGLEIKSSTWRMKSRLGDEGTSELPSDWFVQAQQQMAVMGWKRVHFCILIDLVPRLHVVERDDSIIDMMIRAERDLVERIRDGRPPAADYSHASTLDLIKAIHKTVADTRIVLNAEEIEAWEEYQRLGKQVSEIEKQRDSLKARVLSGIGDHGGGLLGNGKMVRRSWRDPVEMHFTKKWYIHVDCVKADAGPVVERDSAVSPVAESPVLEGAA